MRRILAGLLLIAFAAGPLHIATALAQGTPKIYIEEMRFDLGEVYEADVYKHRFAVQNQGDADLVIEKVKPG